MNLQKLADQLLPFLLPLLKNSSASSAQSGGGGPLAQHQLSGSLHVGTLADEQAPQFLKADGSRGLTGNLDVAPGVTIDGVDISAHAGNPAAHHAPATAGDGISVTGQQIAVNGTVVRTTRQIIAGDGLIGGGTLAADRTISVGAGTLISVGADTVGISPGSSYQFIGTGSGTTATWRNVSELAGDGLSASNGALAVGVANTGAVGLSVETDVVRLTTSSNPGAAAKVLASDANGILTLVQLTGTTRVRTPLIDTEAGVSMTISPNLDLILNPGGGRVIMGNGDVIQASNYASQTAGWRITDTGEADFRYLFVDEMHAKTFIADLEQALAGGQIISKSVAVLAAAFTAPAAGGATTLRVRDLPSAPNMPVFQPGDIVRLRKFSRASGNLTITDCWGTVSNYVDQADGTQNWTFTRSPSPNAGAMAAGTVVTPDAIVLDYGTSGNGYYEINAIDGTYGLNSPYAQVVSWVTHPATDQTVRTRLGNLRGIFGVANEYGLYAGAGTSVNDAHLRISNTGVGLYNLPLRMYSGGVERVHIAAHDDVWIGPSSADKRLSWDGSTLAVKGSIVVQSGSSGYANLSDRPTSLAGINPVEYAQLVTGKNTFTETWDGDSPLSNWTNVNGAGELILITDPASQTGGKFLRVGNNSGNDQAFLVSNRLIPFNPDKLYKVRVVLRRTAGAGVVYCGVAGVASNGGTLVNISGSNTYNSQHYVAALGASPPAIWTEYVGYVQGWGSPNGTFGSPTTPAVLHADVRYMRPLVLVNSQNQPGITEIDTFEITEYDWPTSAGLYLTPYYSGYWAGGEWRSYFDKNGNFYLNAGASSNYLSWNGSTLTVSGTINVLGGNAAKTDLSNSAISTLINGSSIRVGSGTKDINLNGWNIDGAEIVGQKNGEDQVALDTNGRIIAGAGTVALDKYGYLFQGNLINSDPWPSFRGGVHAVGDINNPTATYRGALIYGMPSGVWAQAPQGWLFRYPGILQQTSPPGGGPSWGTALIICDDDGAAIVWHSKNDGAGSGMDADLLDGYHASAFVKFSDNLGSWTTLSLNSPWTNFGSGWATAAYCIFGDWVLIRGLVQPTANVAANSTIATLPSAARPSQNRRFFTSNSATSSNANMSELDIYATGAIVIKRPVSANFPVSIECMFKK